MVQALTGSSVQMVTGIPPSTKRRDGMVLVARHRAEDHVAGERTLDGDAARGDPVEQARVGGGGDGVTDARQARDFERLRQVQRAELAGVGGDAQPRLPRTLRPAMYHGPVLPG